MICEVFCKLAVKFSIAAQNTNYVVSVKYNSCTIERIKYDSMIELPWIGPMTLQLLRKTLSFNIKIFLIVLSGIVASAHAAPGPRLNFSDLINGPDVGLGDGSGSGAVVTIWGQHLGDVQAGSTLHFRDSTGVIRQPHIYYWKKADGQLPGGPADLYSSHRMQEIAFSIPDSALGEGEIYVRVDGVESNALPFTVRDGNIYHVMSTGNDSTGDGSFGSPWRTVAGGPQANIAELGAITYIHDVDTLGDTSNRGIEWGESGVGEGGTLANQSALIAYPGEQPISRGKVGVHFYEVDAFVVSKMTVETGNCSSVNGSGYPSGCDDSSFTRGITTTNNGRTIANYITDMAGTCSSDATGGGAIQGNSRYYDYIFNAKVLGNEIEGYGCQGSHQQHHTTYFSIRSGNDNEQGPAPEVAYNYLHDNWPRGGIHFFDKEISGSTTCGNFTTTLAIHNNVIIEQGGAGISVNGSSCSTWAVDTSVYNNVLYNVGKRTDQDKTNCNTPNYCSQTPGGLSFGANGGETIRAFNNTIINWDPDDISGGGDKNPGCVTFTAGGTTGTTLDMDFYDNICQTNTDDWYSGWANRGDGATVDNGSNNVFHYSGNGSPSRAITPDWANDSMLSAPQLQVTGAYVTVSDSSPVLNAATRKIEFDIYGNQRGLITSVGAVSSADISIMSPPNPPSNISYTVVPIN